MLTSFYNGFGEDFIKVFLFSTFHLFLIEKIIPQAYIAQPYEEDFRLIFTNKIIAKSNYNVINFMDARSDTANLGFVFSGPQNKRVAVIPRIEFPIQFNGLLKTSTDSSSAEGELLFQLRKFKFAERLESDLFNICLLRADLFVKNNNVYTKLDRIDTIITLEATEAAAGLFKETSYAITSFVLTNLKRKILTNESYTYYQLLHIDSIEKSKLKLYRLKENEFINGAYETFESFKNQTPDSKITDVIYRQGKVVRLKTLDKKGKKHIVKPKQIYAFVFVGNPFISAKYDCYKLNKVNSDFVFAGEDKTEVKGANEVIAGTVGFAFAGKMGKAAARKIASNSAIAFFEIKIDHIDGSFIRIKQTKN